MARLQKKSAARSLSRSEKRASSSVVLLSASIITFNEEHRIFELGRETQITRKEAASSGTICYAHMTPTLITRWKNYPVTEEAL